MSEVTAEKTYPFDEKVRAMSAKEVIMAMVDGLKKEWVTVDMDTFGSVVEDVEKEVCVGCAATNTVCQLLDRPLTPEEVDSDRPEGYWKRIAAAVGASPDFLRTFEGAIDELRQGDLYYYNLRASEIGVAKIKPVEGGVLDWIENYNYADEDVLQGYIDLANGQEEN